MEDNNLDGCNLDNDDLSEMEWIQILPSYYLEISVSFLKYLVL